MRANTQKHTLTRALGAGDESLARVAHLEDGGRLDVVPLLEGHRVHPVRAGQSMSTNG